MRIDRSLLAAVGCAATEKNRYAINGLYLQNGPQGQYAAATNGRYLIIVQGKPPEKGEDRDEIAVILAPDTVKEALKKMGTKKGSARDAAIAIDGNKEYYVSGAVLIKIAEILKLKPSVSKFSVTKTGTGLATKYKVEALD